MIKNQTPVEPAPTASASNKKWIWWLVGGGCAVFLCVAIVIVGAAILYLVPVTTH